MAAGEEGFYMKKKLGAFEGFTLIEVLIALAVLLVLSSVGIFGYNRLIDRAYRNVCETNLKVLNMAIKFYSEEFDVLPATLGKMERKHFDRAYAKVMGENPWGPKINLLLAKLDRSGDAHAALLTYENLKPVTNKENFVDPADTNGGTSYGINSALAGKKWSQINDSEIVVADVDTYLFSSTDEIVRRHRKGLGAEMISMAVMKNNKVVEFSESSTAGLPSSLNGITTYFADLVSSNLNTPIADKAEDVQNKLLAAQTELAKTSPDIIAAQGNITGAHADLQAMINDGLIDPAVGLSLISRLQEISTQL